MLSHVFDSFKIIEQRKKKNADFLVETKVDLSFIYPDTFGTVDVAIAEEFGELDVIDFKYGAGIPVDPEENPQLIYYALGIAHLYDFNFKHVNLIIVQPRTPHSGGIFKTWRISIEDLIMWRERFESGIQRATALAPKLSAGDWCKFCPAASICPEISQNVLKQAQIDFEPELGIVELPPTHELSNERLGITLEAVERLETWIGALRAHAFEAMKRGEIVPGWKLVPRRATRKWENPEKVEKEAKKKFGLKAFETSLLSPAQFEKKVDKAFVEKYCVSVSSGVTLAHESDKRSGINPVDADFTCLE
jgi:hypothetical protein